MGADWLSLIFLLALGYIYGGYYFLLRFLASIRGQQEISWPTKVWPGITVYFSALNEEKNICSRLQNVLENSYPLDKLEIIVVSDGSTDDTVARVKDFVKAYPNTVRLIEFESNRGQAHAQNIVTREARFDILVSTDVESRFEQNMLAKLVSPFALREIGVAGGIVRYVPDGAAAVGESYAIYRSMEEKIRNLETHLGIGFKTDGPCVAYRREIWEPIQDHEDVDQVIGLLAHKKNFLTVQVDDAICYDRANDSERQEIRSRARMCRKGLLSQFGRWGWKDVMKCPSLTFALYSHKILRYFSPVFVVGAGLSAADAIFDHGLIMEAGSGLLLVVLVTVVGHALKVRRIVQLYGLSRSFLVAQVGFALGIFGWLSRDKTGHYKPTRQIT